MELVIVMFLNLLGMLETKLTILSPSSFSSHVLIPPATETSIPIKLKFDGTNMPTEVCLTLRESNNIHFENNCIGVENDDLVLSSLFAGKYELRISGYVGEDGQVDSEVVNFDILNMEDNLPIIQARSSPLFFIANDTSNASDVIFNLEVPKHPLESELDICIQVRQSVKLLTILP